MKKLQIIEPGFIFEPHTQSISFDGVDEVMGDVGPNTIGIANTWSLMMWINRSSASPGQISITRIFSLGFDAGSDNVIRIESRGNANPNAFTVVTTNSAGGVIKNWRFEPSSVFFTYDVWHQVILIWDGTDLTLYEDGVNITGSAVKFDDNAGTMTDSARDIFIGRLTNALGIPWPGFQHSIALWDADITSAVAEIYNGGVASTLNLRNASFNTNLQHWWRLGQDSSDIGKDSGRGTKIDMNVSSVNITSDDIVSESPA